MQKVIGLSSCYMKNPGGEIKIEDGDTVMQMSKEWLFWKTWAGTLNIGHTEYRSYSLEVKKK